jgi:prepilin-type N-terminal cleavage/methylation domain-containing protein
MRRRAFTLVEMMIAITLFSVVMIFLYQSVASLVKSNQFYGAKLEAMTTEQFLLKTLYLDLALAVPSTDEIINIEKNEDIVLMQTSNIIHTHIMPYVAYFIKNKHLYRIESSTKLTYPFERDLNVVIDDFGEVGLFRLYKNSTHFLLEVNLDGKTDNFLKIRNLNGGN